MHKPTTLVFACRLDKTISLWTLSLVWAQHIGNGTIHLLGTVKVLQAEELSKDYEKKSTINKQTDKSHLLINYKVQKFKNH